MMMILPISQMTPLTVRFFCWKCYPQCNTQMFWNGGWGTLLHLSRTKIVLRKPECPVTICTIDIISAVKSRWLLRVLFDSGSMVSIIKRSTLPQKVSTITISETKNYTSLAGKVQAQEVVTLRDLRLPKFDKNRCIRQQKSSVLDNDKVKYHIILVTNFLSQTGIKLNYSEGKMEWFDCSIPLHPPGGLDA